MSGFLIQIVFGFRVLDIEDSGWMQLLVFAVMAVIYALGSISKSKKAKSKEAEQTPLVGKGKRKFAITSQDFKKETIPVAKPVGTSADGREIRPPAVYGGDVEAAGGDSSIYRFRKAIEAVVKAAVMPEGQTDILQQIESLWKSKAAATRKEQSVFPVTEIEVKTPQIVKSQDVETKSQPEEKKAQFPEEFAKVEYHPEIVFNYADPAEMRKAILYSEILGKPLSLREPE
jgi:hypothetical protein